MLLTGLSGLYKGLNSVTFMLCMVDIRLQWYSYGPLKICKLRIHSVYSPNWINYSWKVCLNFKGTHLGSSLVKLLNIIIQPSSQLSVQKVYKCWVGKNDSTLTGLCCSRIVEFDIDLVLSIKNAFKNSTRSFFLFPYKSLHSN